MYIVDELVDQRSSGSANRRPVAGRLRGFTLIEVLIVIAIIGLLVSLSIPAIQASREAARRTQCTSNLRQLGVALQSYEDVHHVLPPMVIWHPAGEPLGKGILPPGMIDRLLDDSSEDKQEDRTYANWLCMLLPFLEETALEASLDSSVPIGHEKNKSLRATDLPVLKCPSDAYNSSDNHYRRSLLTDATEADYARGNYAMNFGTNESCVMGFTIPGSPFGDCTDGYQVDGSDLKNNVRAVWGSGIGGVNRSMALREFGRGTSTMVALDEIRAGVDPVDPRGVWALGFVGASATAGHGIHRQAGGPNNPSPQSDVIANCKEVRSRVGGSISLAALGMGCNPWVVSSASFEAGSRSLHPGGVNLLMLGGSVHFVDDDIDANVWHNMHRRDYQGPLDLPF